MKEIRTIMVSCIKENIILFGLLCLAALMVVDYLKSGLGWVVPFNWTIPLYIVVFVAEVVSYYKEKRERKMRIINEIKKLDKEFEKFVYTAYTTSLPAITNNLLADGQFISGKKNMKKTIKVWGYYFNLLYDILSKNYEKAGNLLNSTEALANLQDLIKEHYKYHEKFKEMVGDLGHIPDEYVNRYNEGVKEYNEFFSVLNKFVIDNEDAAHWFKGFYFFKRIEELKIIALEVVY